MNGTARGYDCSSKDGLCEVQKRNNVDVKALVQDMPASNEAQYTRDMYENDALDKSCASYH